MPLHIVSIDPAVKNLAIGFLFTMRIYLIAFENESNLYQNFFRVFNTLYRRESGDEKNVILEIRIERQLCRKSPVNFAIENFLRGMFSVYLHLNEALAEVRIVTVPAKSKMQYTARELAWNYFKVKSRKKWVGIENAQLKTLVESFAIFTISPVTLAISEKKFSSILKFDDIIDVIIMLVMVISRFFTVLVHTKNNMSAENTLSSQ